MSTSPPPLDYSSPQTPPPEGSWGLFVLGAIAGIVFSACYYLILGWSGVASVIPFVAFGAVVIKIVVGIRLLRVPPARRFGIGLIASIPLAILIFVGICFTIIAKI
jgi:hypothetical protein